MNTPARAHTPHVHTPRTCTLQVRMYEGSAVRDARTRKNFADGLEWWCATGGGGGC